MADAFRIRFDYDRAAAHPVGDGYTARPAIPLRGIVYHSTEHGPGQTFAACAAYLRDSDRASAHYLVGPDGEIQRILDPGPWAAWHAGYSYFAELRDWNDFAVGIECFHRAGDPWPDVQREALAWLARTLVTDHPTILYHVLHRWIACNPYDAWRDTGGPVYGRKIDPTNWPAPAFHDWLWARVLRPLQAAAPASER